MELAVILAGDTSDSHTVEKLQGWQEADQDREATSSSELAAVAGALNRVFAGDGQLLEDGDRLVLAHHLVQVLPVNAMSPELAQAMVAQGVLESMKRGADTLLAEGAPEGTGEWPSDAALLLHNLFKVVEGLLELSEHVPGLRGTLGTLFADSCVQVLADDRLTMELRRRAAQLLPGMFYRELTTAERVLCSSHFQDFLLHQMVSIGDFNVEMFVLEMLVRGIRTLKDAFPESCLAWLPERVQRDFKAQAQAVGTQGTQVQCLEKALHAMTLELNNELGAAASVHSFQAAAVAVTETTAVEADDGGWVHFGAAHFSLRMLVSTSSPMMDEDDIPAELHIEYGDVSGAKLTAVPSSEGGPQEALHFRLRETPASLTGVYAADNSDQWIVLTFARATVEQMRRSPHAIRLLKLAGVTESQEDAIQGPTQQPRTTQAPASDKRKVSRGSALPRARLNLQPSEATPAPSMRTSLPLRPSAVSAEPPARHAARLEPAREQHASAAPPEAPQGHPPPVEQPAREPDGRQHHAPLADPQMSLSAPESSAEAEGDHLDSSTHQQLTQQPVQQEQRSRRDQAAAARAAMRELSSIPGEEPQLPSSPPSPAQAAKQRHRQREAQAHGDAPGRAAGADSSAAALSRPAASARKKATTVPEPDPDLEQGAARQADEEPQWVQQRQPPAGKGKHGSRRQLLRTEQNGKAAGARKALQAESETEYSDAGAAQAAPARAPARQRSKPPAAAAPVPAKHAGRAGQPSKKYSRPAAAAAAQKTAEAPGATKPGRKPIAKKAKHVLPPPEEEEGEESGQDGDSATEPEDEAAPGPEGSQMEEDSPESSQQGTPAEDSNREEYFPAPKKAKGPAKASPAKARAHKPPKQLKKKQQQQPPSRKSPPVKARAKQQPPAARGKKGKQQPASMYSNDYEPSPDDECPKKHTGTRGRGRSPTPTGMKRRAPAREGRREAPTAAATNAGKGKRKAAATAAGTGRARQKAAAAEGTRQARDEGEQEGSRRVRSRRDEEANAAFEQLPSLLEEEEEEGTTAMAAEHSRPPPRHRPQQHQSPSTSRLQVLTVRKRTAVVEQTELLRDRAGSLELEGDIGIDLMPLESTDLADSGKVRHLELLGGRGSDAGDACSMLTSAQTLQQLSSASAKRLSGEQVPATNVMQDPGPSRAPSIQGQHQQSSPSSLHEEANQGADLSLGGQGSEHEQPTPAMPGSGPRGRLTPSKRLAHMSDGGEGGSPKRQRAGQGTAAGASPGPAQRRLAALADTDKQGTAPAEEGEPSPEGVPLPSLAAARSRRPAASLSGLPALEPGDPTEQAGTSGKRAAGGGNAGKQSGKTPAAGGGTSKQPDPHLARLQQVADDFEGLGGSMEEGDDIDAQLAAQEMAARNAITQLFKQRALQARRKQTKMVQELRDTLAGDVEALEAELAAEEEDAHAQAQQQMDALLHRLQAHQKAIQAQTEAYQKAVQERWGQYRADHAQLKPLQAKLERARTERAKAAKRKLQEMEQHVASAVAQRERELQEIEKAESIRMQQMALFDDVLKPI